MDKIKFIKRLIEEKIQLLPCDGNNKPILDFENFRKNLLEFNKALYHQSKLTTFITNQNLAIVTGEINKIIAVDIDIEFSGTIIWRNLLKKFNCGNDIQSVKVHTPSGGLHYYFTYETKKFQNFESIYRPYLNGFGKVGIDLIAENGYVMMPFSKKNERQYQIHNYDPKFKLDDQVIKIPNWLYSIFRTSKKAIIRRLYQ